MRALFEPHADFHTVLYGLGASLPYPPFLLTFRGVSLYLSQGNIIDEPLQRELAGRLGILQQQLLTKTTDLQSTISSLLHKTFGAAVYNTVRGTLFSSPSQSKNGGFYIYGGVGVRCVFVRFVSLSLSLSLYPQTPTQTNNYAGVGVRCPFACASYTHTRIHEKGTRTYTYSCTNLHLRIHICMHSYTC